MTIDGDRNPDAGGSATTWPSGELLRLIFVPSIIVILFIGGVYWLRLQVDSAGGLPEPQSVVQVRLLPRPDPIPIPASDSKATATAAIAPGQVSEQNDDAVATHQQVSAALPTEMPAASPPSPGMVQAPASDAPPDFVTLQFGQALLRHIARYQRYPKAAEAKGLQGTVKAVFSMDREGKLLGVWIRNSSGQAALDRAAIDTIRRAAPLPAIPSALPDSIKVDIALGFDPP